MRPSNLHLSLSSIAALAIAALAVGCQPESGAELPEGPAATDRAAATASAGAKAVVSRKCVTCHGDDMAGKKEQLVGSSASRAELFPPNLTPDIETGLGDPREPDPAKRGYSDELLARAIRQGFDRNDQQLCPQMTHFAEMTDFEVYSIVKYLRSLPPVKRTILRSVCVPLKTKAEQTAQSR